MAELYGPARLDDRLGRAGKPSSARSPPRGPGAQRQPVSDRHPGVRIRRHRPPPTATTTYIKTAQALRTLENLVGSQPVRRGDADLCQEVRVPSPDRARPVRHPRQRARPGPRLVHGPGVPRRRQARARAAPRPAAGRSMRRAACFGDGSAKKTVTEVEAPESGDLDLRGSSCRTPGRSTCRSTSRSSFADGSTKRLRWDDRGRERLGSGSPSSAARRSSRSGWTPRARSRSTTPDDPSLPGSPATARPGLRAGAWFGSFRRRPSCRSWGP